MKNRSTLRLFLWVAGFIALNLIASFFFFRLDFTADQRYTLSKATKNILQQIGDSSIQVTAYFSKDLPPQLLTTRQDFEDLLREYQALSKGKLSYQFINPNESEEKEREAQMKGIAPLLVNVAERDQMKQIRAYMGAILKRGKAGEEDVIPVIQSSGGMEYTLTTSIKKLTTVEKPGIAFLQGHGEPRLSALSDIRQALSVLYTPEHYTITDSTSIPLKYKALVIIGPKYPFDSISLIKIDNYLDSGGNLLIAYSPVRGELQQMMAYKNEENAKFHDWLAKKGIRFKDKALIDKNCGQVSVQQQIGPFSGYIPVAFPYFPYITNFSDHATTQGLEAVMFTFSAPIRTDSLPEGVDFTSLAYSSEVSGLVDLPVIVNIQKQWTKADFNVKSQTVAAGINLSKPKGRIILFANGDFCVNGDGERERQLPPDNINWVVNTIEWLSDDTGLGDLRTKGVALRLLEPVEDTLKNLLKYGNFLLPILVILGYGLYRKQVARRKREDWIQEKY
ncbi:MAG: Gldg family protein [Cytophagales bacterium]|nr:Gldg family protein [Cytophagales bacterium]MDW8384565.1 Gldg family protein [Flammeovirgaceae bacterium]